MNLFREVGLFQLKESSVTKRGLRNLICLKKGVTKNLTVVPITRPISITKQQSSRKRHNETQHAPHAYYITGIRRYPSQESPNPKILATAPVDALTKANPDNTSVSTARAPL